MKKSKIVFIIICSLLVAALIVACIAPFPKRIDMSLSAQMFTREETEYIQDVPVALKGRLLRYLLRDDKMEISIELESNGTDQRQQTQWPVYDMENGFQFCTFSYYDSAKNSVNTGNFVFNDDFSEYAFGFGDQTVFYVASSDPDADLQETAREFKEAGSWFND